MHTVKNGHLSNKMINTAISCLSNVYNLRKMLHVHNAISGKKSDDGLDVTCVYIKVQKNKESNKIPYRIIS